MSIWDIIRTILRPPSTAPLPPPNCPKTGITSAEISSILQRDLGVPADKVFLSDSVYDLYSKGTLQTFLNQDDTNRTVYVPESQDCDDFAYELMGNESKWSAPPKGDPVRKGSTAFGIIWGQIQGVGAHALNWFISADDMKAYLVEPQNDDIYPLPTGSVAWVVFC